jgi:serine/threonine-protein kinase RsbT
VSGGRAEIRVAVREEADVVMARKHARELAVREGFPENRTAALATAVSEVARNIVIHARGGEVVLAAVSDRGRRAIVVIARDGAPGIADVERAMRDGYSTGRGLGLGLPGAKRLMDEFALDSAPGRGTTVTMKKWAHGRDD